MRRALLAEAEAARVARIVAEDKEPKRRVAPCGTVAAFWRHYRRKETPCDPCREAHREWGRRADRRRKGQPEDLPKYARA